MISGTITIYKSNTIQLFNKLSKPMKWNSNYKMRFNLINKRYKNTSKNLRQHVNPLKPYYQQPIVLDKEWIDNGYTDPTKAMIIDIGCGKGMWVNDMSISYPQYNHLGIDIRQTVIDIANKRYIPKTETETETKCNIHFICGNANVNIDRILTDIISRNIPIHTICIQFPDPQFKKKHYKRRLVNLEFINILTKHMYQQNINQSKSKSKSNSDSNTNTPNTITNIMYMLCRILNFHI